jgi:hypothetical protein
MPTQYVRCNWMLSLALDENGDPCRYMAQSGPSPWARGLRQNTKPTKPVSASTQSRRRLLMAYVRRIDASMGSVRSL